MGARSNIAWTHASFNPWWGCTKVSPGCDHCYAERLAAPGVRWGVGARRREFGEAHWQAPLLWNARAAREGQRLRVFCASMADVFDTEAPAGARERLFKLIRQTQRLDWLLLTKRIGNAPRMLPADWGPGYPNVWLGITVVNQLEADRDIDKLLRLPAAVRWVSMEPLLGPVRLSGPGLDGIVVGGESGPYARPMQADWARALLADCRSYGIAFFMKQGSEANWPDFKNFASFPHDLQVREPPRPSRAAPQPGSLFEDRADA